MKHRLYFLLPDVETTHRVVEKLLLERVKEDDMYIVARAEDNTRDLPEAGIAQTSDLTGAAERGAAAGAVTGVLAGLTAMAFPPLGIAIGGGVAAATGFTGAGFGAWMSSMIGVRHDNAKVAQYREAIDNGQVLMMVDGEQERLDEIERIIKAHHRDVEIAGTDPHKPAFP